MVVSEDVTEDDVVAVTALVLVIDCKGKAECEDSITADDVML